MRRNNRGRYGVLLAAIAVVLALTASVWPSSAMAADVRQDEQSVTIRSSETIRDDLYVFGSTIDIEGRVEGDVIAFGSVVTVDGEVTGDVIAGSSDVSIDGRVGGSVRAGAGTLSITGNVTEDVVAGSGRVRIAGDATVGRDLVAGAGEMNIEGDVGRNLLAGTGTLTIGGTVGGDAEVSTGDIDFGPDGRIEGDLLYRSERERDIPSDAVGGEVTFRETPKTETGGAAQGALFWFLSWIRGLVGMALLTLIVTLLFPAFSLTAAGEIRLRPLLSVGIGLAVFFGVPIVATFVFILGILVGGWWLGLMLMALYVIALVVGVVMTAVFVGSWLLGLMNRPVTTTAVWAGLLGLLVIWLIRLIPIVGTLVLWIAMLFGVGAAVLAAVDTSRRCSRTVSGSPNAPL